MQDVVKKVLVTFLFFLFFIGNQLFSQVPGSLFLIPDNFYSQMLNPSFMRHDKAVQIALPGLAGFSVYNQGNFKVSDLIRVDENRNPYLDFNHFYEYAKMVNRIEQNLSVPVFFIGLPVDNGRISFYYKENVQSFTSFKINPIEFLLNGNVGSENLSFNTEDLNLSFLGYKEFAFGYAHKLNNKIDLGFRFKVLYSEAYANLNSWDYQVSTSASGDEVHLQAGGEGQIYLPVSLELTERNQIDYIDGKNVLGKYLRSFKNPGLALDLGLNYHVNEKNSVSFAVRDFGGLWFRKNAMNIEQRGDLNFSGFDITDATRYPGALSYLYPWSLMEDEKDRVREVFLPFVDTTSFFRDLPLRAAFNYKYSYSDRLLFGITNQSVFKKNNVLSKLTFTALHKTANFSFFENMNIYGFNEINFGGGFQYEGAYGQFFLAVDNIMAFYHPAGQKAYSIAFGASILLNREKEEFDKKLKESPPGKRINSKGKFSKYLPFYKNKH